MDCEVATMPSSDTQVTPETRTAIARELYAARCRDKGDAPSALGSKHFLNSVAKQASERPGDSHALRLRSLQLGPRTGVVLMRSLAGTEIELLDLSDNPGLGDALGVALLPLIVSGQLSSIRLGACGLRGSLVPALVQALSVAADVRLTALHLGGAPTGELSVSTQLGLRGENRLPKLAALLRALARHCPALRELGLSHLGLSESADIAATMSALAALVRDASVTALDVSHNQLPVDTLAPLIDALPTARGLRALDLSHNPLGDDGAAALAGALSPLSTAALAEPTEATTGLSPKPQPREPQLTKPQRTATLSALLRTAPVGTGLSGGGQTAARLAAEARLDAAVASADDDETSLFRMNMSPQRARSAGRPMSSPRDRPLPARRLAARPQSSAPAGRAAAAATALSTVPGPAPTAPPRTAAMLDVLSIAGAGLGEAGAGALGRALASGECVLRSLDASENPGMGEAGIAALCRGMTRSRLTSLNLTACGITERGAASVGTALRAYNRLQALRLPRNPLGDSGAVALAAALIRNTGLRSLDASRAGIGDEGAVAMCLALQRNRTLTRLRLDQNLISAEGGEAMLRELRLAMETHRQQPTAGGPGAAGGNGGRGPPSATRLRTLSAVPPSASEADGGGLESLSVSGNSVSFSAAKEMRRLCDLNRSRRSVPPSLERAISELAKAEPALEAATAERAAIDARAAEIAAEVAQLEQQIAAVRALSDTFSGGGQEVLSVHQTALAKAEAARQATRQEREAEHARFAGERDAVQMRVKAEQERARSADATATETPVHAAEQEDEAISELRRLDLALAANGARIEHARAKARWAEAQVDAVNITAAAHFAAEAARAAAEAEEAGAAKRGKPAGPPNGGKRK